jgi:hypothetical protein
MMTTIMVPLQRQRHGAWRNAYGESSTKAKLDSCNILRFNAKTKNPTSPTHLHMTNPLTPING